MKLIGRLINGKWFTIARLFTIYLFTITRFDCKYFYCAQPSFDRIFHSIAFRKMIDLYLLVFFNCDAFLFPAIIILIYEVILSFNFSISSTYLKATFTIKKTLSSFEKFLRTSLNSRIKSRQILRSLPELQSKFVMFSKY